MKKLLLPISLALLWACSNNQKTTAFPVAETTPVDNSDDAADDPAIWIHPVDPARSLVLGTNKQLGLDVYNLEGSRIQTIEQGRLNNVDLRQGVQWDNRIADIAVATNRTTIALDMFSIDRETGMLSFLKAVPLQMQDPYGVCLYYSLHDQRLYAFVNDKDGDYQQWWLNPQPGEPGMVRDFKVASQPEGCTADDDNSTLYFGEEEVGIWRLDASPESVAKPVQVDHVKNGRVRADIEGMALYKKDTKTGYLVVSSQGDNSYAVYRREGDNDYLGSFQISTNHALRIDGTSETDGLDVTSIAVGTRYPEGMLVVQDGYNTNPRENQNFKYISWQDIKASLGLD